MINKKLYIFKKLPSFCSAGDILRLQLIHDVNKDLTKNILASGYLSEKDMDGMKNIIGI